MEIPVLDVKITPKQLIHVNLMADAGEEWMRMNKMGKEHDDELDSSFWVADTSTYHDEGFTFGQKCHKEIAEKLCDRYKIKDEDVDAYEDQCSIYWKDVHVAIIEIIIISQSNFRKFTETGNYIVRVAKKDRQVYSAGIGCPPITWKKLVEVLDMYLPRKDEV